MSTQKATTGSSENFKGISKLENKQNQSKTGLIAFTVLYGILALVVIYVVTSAGMGVSYDSERYLISANHLEQGEVEQAFKIVSPTFPIFYPFTISMVSWLGWGDGTGAARLISILAFVVSIMAVFHLGLLIQGRATAHLSAVSLLVFAPLLFVFSYCWSETLYLPLSLLFLLMLILHLKTPPDKSAKYLMASGLLAGLGLLTRYIGVSLIITGFLAIFFLTPAERVSRKLKEIIFFGGMASLPPLFYLLGCQIYLHRVFRGNVASGFSLIEQAGLFILTIYRDLLTFYLTFDKNIQLLFNSNLQVRLGHFLLLSHMVILFCVLFGGFLLVKTFIASKSFRTLLRSQLEVLGYVVIYSLLVISITSGVAVDRMGTRFAAPVYPLFLILAFSITAHLYKSLDKRKLKRLLIRLSILTLGLFWVIQVISSYNLYKSVRSGSFSYMEQPGNLNRESLRFLRENVDSSDIIISNVPYKLSFIWPRRLPYLGISMVNDLPSTRLAITEIPDSLSLLWPWEIKDRSIFKERPELVPDDSTTQLDHRSVYILLCTKDFSHYSIPLETIEELNRKNGLYSWKRIFGNDYVFKTEALVFDSPQEKQCALEKKLANMQAGRNHQ